MGNGVTSLKLDRREKSQLPFEVPSWTPRAHCMTVEVSRY